MLYEIEVEKKRLTEYFTDDSEHYSKISEGGLPEECDLIGVRGDKSGRFLIFSFFKNDGKPEVKRLLPIVSTRRE